MLMRRIVDNGIRVREDEMALSEETKEVMFRGPYSLADTLVSVESSQSSIPNDAAPHHLKITRLGLLQAFGFNTGPYVRTITSDESMSHIAMEMRSPRALRRLARIERYAFRTKFALALIAMYSVHNPPFTKSHESVHSINTPGVIERPLNLPLNSEDVQATRSPDQKTDPEE